MSTQTLPASTLKPGDARWWFGSLAVIKATTAETDGAYSIVEVTGPPGLGTPLHVHYRDDEGFYVLDGRARFEVGDQVAEGGPGDFLFGPRDIPHRWTAIGEDPIRMLFILNPGGFETLVESTSVPAGALTPPPADVGPPADAAEIVRSLGYELLG
jgi:quercetin dioxygenase-like cupin family protein